MNTQLMPLYLSAASAIVAIVAFARHNRKTGWTKPRPTVQDALNGFYADLGLVAEPPAPQIPLPATWSPAQSADFSLQLLKLRKSLGSARPITVTEASPVFAVQSR
jgi:hypothetical protein